MGEAEQLAKLRPWDNIVCITTGQGGILNMQLCRLTPSAFLTPSSSCACLHFRVEKAPEAFFLALPDSRCDFFQIHLSGGHLCRFEGVGHEGNQVAADFSVVWQADQPQAL